MKYQKKKSSYSYTGDFFKSVTAGIVVGAVFLFVLIMLFSLAVVLTGNIPLKFISILLKIFIGASGFAGAYVCARLLKRNGMLCGMAASFGITLVIIAYKLVFGETNFGASEILNVFIMILIGALAGIISVNKKNKNRKLYK